MNLTDSQTACNVIDLNARRFNKFDKLIAYVVTLFNREKGDAEFKAEVYCLANLINLESKLVAQRKIFLSKEDKGKLKDLLSETIANLY